jgi:RHS repeat-associated protein
MDATRLGRAWQAAVGGGGSSRRRAGVLAVRGVCTLATVLAVVFVLLPAAAAAESLCTDTWTGPSKGTWATGADWSTGKVPTSADVACIGSGKTVEANEGSYQTGVVQGEGSLVIYRGSLEITNALEVSRIAALTLTEGTTSVAGDLDVSSSLSVSEASAVDGSGQLTVESSATGTFGNSGTCSVHLTLDDATFVNEGTVTFGASGGAPAGAIAMENGARLNNAGTFNMDSYDPGCERHTIGESIANGGGTTPVVTNTGTFNVNIGSATQTSIRASFVNNGTVDTQSGTVYISGGGSSTKGIWSAGSGTTVGFANSSYSQSEGEWSGAGTFSIESGTVTGVGLRAGAGTTVSISDSGTLTIAEGHPSAIPLLTLTGGTLRVEGELDVSSSLSIENSPVINGSGKLVVQSGATGTIGNGGTCTVHPTLEGATFVNEGTVTFGASGGAPDGAIVMKNGAQLDNESTFNVDSWDPVCERGTGHESIANGGGTASTLTNAGTLNVELGAGDEGGVSVNFENQGSIVTTSGKLIIHDPVLVEEDTQWGGAESPSTPNELHPTCGKPVSCATGNESESQTDFAVGGRGVGLDLTRYYNSQAAADGIKGPFGYGWTGSFSDHLVVNKTSKISTLYQADGSTVPFAEESGGAFKAPLWTQDTLSGTEGTGYTLTLADQIKYKFAGSTGRLESVTDRDGNATTLTYNESGQLTTITDPVSRTIKLTYNGEGLVESAEDPMKHVVKYTYESGNLKSVTQPAEAGLRWQFKYDGSHRMTEMVDGRSGKTINEYNGSNQVIKQEDPAGHKLKFEYEPFHTAITNETTGSVTSEYFTSNDEPSSITRGYGTASATTESFTYNAGGYVTSVTNGDGHTTKYGYDSANDRTSMIDPDSDETKWTYNSTHDVETETTPKGETTTIKRESHGNPEVVERPAPESKTQITRYKYTAHGELESVTNPLENVWKYEYDSEGDRTAETDPIGNKRTWEYNEDSQVTAEVSPRGNIAGGKPESFKTKFERNALGLPLKITDPLSHVTEYKYDGDYNVEAVTDGNKHTTKYTYNGDNEPIKVEEPNKTLTETEYDGDGQVVSQTNGNKHKTKYVRNAVEEVTEEVNALGKKTVKEYDGAGNLVKATDPESHTTTYTYDPANRLTEVSCSTGKPATIKYEYDKDGDRTKMTDGTGTTKYVYDQLDRLTESENGNKEVVKYEYNIGNEQTKITYPNKKAVTHTFDKDGRLEKLTDWLTHATKFTYNEDSGLKVMVFPSETKDEDKYTYNDADQMSEIKMDKGSEVLASLVYTRDSDGQVKKTTSKGLPGTEVTEATYDENNRVTKYGSTEYKYDGDNNPTTEGSTTNTYNEGDELEKGTGVTYTYNELGERTKTTPSSGPATTYGYDQAGNLISVERPEKESVPKIEDSYAYNGEGLRTSQTISGATTYFAWDATEGVPLILSDGTNSYIYGPGGIPVEQINSAEKALYIHHDQAGSTRLITGSSGTVEGKCSYGAYGIPTCEGTATTPLGYDGQYTSGDTGLVYLRARIYDPATAQFLTVDPLVAVTGAPYSYAGDTPLNWADPSGLLSFGEITESVEELGGKVTHAGLDLAAVVPYGVYYASYYASKGINEVGCSSTFGPVEPVTCAMSHGVAAPLVIPEAIGLAGDVAIDELKGELICDEGQRGYINPLHSFLPDSLRGPEIYLPGIHPSGSVDFEW